MESMAASDFEGAVDKFTEAIKLVPSAALFASRGGAFLKMRKPIAAIRDADKALELNPDSAKAFKTRGSGEAMLGRWVKAVHDLNTGQSIDFDEATAEQQKEIKAHSDRVLAKEAKRR
jgi:suppressor of tumorigenicity protein 13